MKINMKRLIKMASIPLLAIGILFMSSCSNNTTKSDDKEVVVMDSVSKDLEQSTKDLEDKNAKLEASLEKVDKEFETAK
jgi:PBP1b-binding outer membrane lipoprotein LpoB